MDSPNKHKNDKSLDRLKKLQEWKEQKVHRERENANKKPAFKVHRVNYSCNLNLSRIYGEIKGKPIMKTSKERPLIKPDKNQKSKPLQVKPSPGTSDTKKNETIKTPTVQKKNYQELSPVPRNLNKIKKHYAAVVATPLKNSNFWKPKYMSTPRNKSETPLKQRV